MPTSTAYSHTREEHLAALAGVKAGVEISGTKLQHGPQRGCIAWGAIRSWQTSGLHPRNPVPPGARSNSLSQHVCAPCPFNQRHCCQAMRVLCILAMPSPAGGHHALNCSQPGLASLRVQTTIMAASFKGGVVLGADTRTSTGAYVANRVTNKLTQLAEKVRDSVAVRHTGSSSMVEPAPDKSQIHPLITFRIARLLYRMEAGVDDRGGGDDALLRGEQSELCLACCHDH